MCMSDLFYWHSLAFICVDVGAYFHEVAFGHESARLPLLLLSQCYLVRRIGSLNTRYVSVGLSTRFISITGP